MLNNAQDRNRILIVIALVISCMFTYRNIKTVIDIKDNDYIYLDTVKDRENLEDEISKLEKELEYKQTDEYILQQAREKLKLGKEGEQVIVIVGDEDNINKFPEEKLSKPDEKIEKEEIKKSFLKYLNRE